MLKVLAWLNGCSAAANLAAFFMSGNNLLNLVVCAVNVFMYFYLMNQYGKEN